MRHDGRVPDRWYRVFVARIDHGPRNSPLGLGAAATACPPVCRVGTAVDCFIKALAALIRAFGKLPQTTAFFLFGLALLAGGCYLLAARPF